MKKLVAFLLVLLAIQSYGIFGAVQAERIVYTCTLEVGPLCYAWEENALVKALGPDAAEKLEDKLDEAKKAWEEDFIKKALGLDKGPIDQAMEKVTEGLEAVQKAFDGEKK